MNSNRLNKEEAVNAAVDDEEFDSNRDEDEDHDDEDDDDDESLDGLNIDKGKATNINKCTR